MNIKDIVKNNTVTFNYYRQGVMYYEVTYNDAEYTFPVPLSDVGDATLNVAEKAILYMRYIRKAIEEGTFVLLK
jgi:hypothetical protein